MKYLTKILTLIAVGFALSAGAADSFQTPFTAVNSANGFNTNSFPTNGLYGTGILSTVIVTNIIPLRTFPAGTTSIQVQAAATGASTTNVVFQIYAATAPVSLSIQTNGASSSPGCFTNSATTPLAYFDTITLGLSGTAPVCTNKSYTIATTPPKANGLNLYLYSVQMGAGTVALTNYSVVVNNL